MAASAYIERLIAKGLVSRENARVFEGVLGDASLAYDNALYAHKYIGPRQRIPMTEADKQVRKLSYGVKGGDPGDINNVALDLMNIIPGDKSKAILVPIPGHTGETASNLTIAEEIARNTGASVKDVLKRQVGPSQRDARVAGGKTLLPDQFGMIATEKLDPENTYFIDNVISSGATIRAARDAVGGGRGLVYAKANPKGTKYGILLPAALGAGAALYPSDSEAMYVGAKPTDWGAFSSLADRMVRKEISDAGSGLFVKEGMANQGKTLGDIFTHLDLYEKYPDLADIKTAVSWSRNAENPGGSFNPLASGSRSPIEARGGSEIETKNILLHEIQHAIQEKEGWAKGGSPVERMINIPYPKKITDMSRRIGYLHDTVMTPWRNERAGKGLAEKEVIDAKWAEKRKQFVDLTNEWNRLTDEFVKKDAYRGYLNLAGEIEARDTAARMGLTAAERQKKPPYGFENIPLKDWILKGQTGIPQMSVVKKGMFPESGEYSKYLLKYGAPVALLAAAQEAQAGPTVDRWKQMRASEETLQPAYGPEDLIAAAATGGTSWLAKIISALADAGINTGLNYAGSR